MAKRRVLWICPFPLPTIPPAGIPGDVEFLTCHDSGDVEDLISQPGYQDFDVVVVDTSPMESHGYDPVGAVSVVATGCSVPPRYLVAVVMRGLNVDHPHAKLAFAVEMHGLWPRNRPVLVIEQAVLYRFEKASVTAGKAAGKGTGTSRPGRPDSKDHAVSQLPRWSDIALRSVLLAEGRAAAASAGSLEIPRLVRAFVEAMCARRGAVEGPRFAPSHRRVLHALARERASVKGLAATLSVGQKYVRKQQSDIAVMLAPYAEWADAESGPPDHSAFCDRLADRFGPWLESRSARARDGQPGQ
jgi:hypothetical protein